MLQMFLKINIIALCYLFLSCAGKSSYDKEKMLLVAHDGFNELDSQFVKKDDRCYVNSFLDNYWSQSVQDVPRLFNETILIANYTAGPTNFSFCLIRDLSKNDSITYLGFPDMYFVYSESEDDSVYSIAEFKNRQLEFVINKYFELKSKDLKYDNAEPLMAFVYSLYFSRRDFVSMPYFNNSQSMSYIIAKYDPGRKWFSNKEDRYFALELKNNLGFTVFDLSVNEQSKIKIREYLILLNQVKVLGSDIIPEMKGCP